VHGLASDARFYSRQVASFQYRTKGDRAYEEAT